MPFTGYKPLGPEERPCFDSEHNPPSHIVLDEGTHIWTCPACGRSQEIVVTKPKWGVNKR